ncbi:MAG: hypothetical protein ACD_10C00027G0002 [uncultured bacterium]|nr:MAG: hypothetical protein ACD_10C00027G0002 [uncultured bacterium]
MLVLLALALVLLLLILLALVLSARLVIHLAQPVFLLFLGVIETLAFGAALVIKSLVFVRAFCVVGLLGLALLIF